MTQPAGLGVDQDLVRAGLGQFDLADDEALAGLFEDCCLGHDTPFVVLRDEVQPFDNLRTSPLLGMSGE
jgi:hypothetical protein